MSCYSLQHAQGVDARRTRLNRAVRRPLSGYDALTSMSLQSVTFAATTNNVTASEVKLERAPLLTAHEVMESHEVFRSAFTEIKARPDSGMRLLKKQKTSATAIQGSAQAPKVVMVPSGLASVILSAYNGHHNLILRPDDVWQAVLTRFSLYMKSHAEKLRNSLVTFRGQKELRVKTDEKRLVDADFGRMASRMVHQEIINNIIDPHLVSWFMPEFTTTTETDRVAASISVMTVMQNTSSTNSNSVVEFHLLFSSEPRRIG